jgi:UDP-glucose 4-epimerase
MNCLVTGAAGFIGSTLSELLLDAGDEVVGVDCFTDYYPREFKERNLRDLRGRAGFRLVEEDLSVGRLEPLLDGIEVVYHLAAQPGVRASWGDTFFHYTQHNMLATQRLFEASVRAGKPRVVYASSSSVYGDCEDLPAREDSVLRPLSPYGVTKAAVEYLGYLYYKNHGLETVGMRYFTVYGPRQRPDMAFHKFIRAGLTGGTFDVYGDGLQSRDFTYVTDAASATRAAALKGRPGTVYNIGGGSRVTLKQVLESLEGIMGRKLAVRYTEKVKGDVRHTAADTSKAAADFGYCPQVSLEDGLAAEVGWLTDFMAEKGAA